MVVYWNAHACDWLQKFSCPNLIELQVSNSKCPCFIITPCMHVPINPVPIATAVGVLQLTLDHGHCVWVCVHVQGYVCVLCSVCVWLFKAWWSSNRKYVYVVYINLLIVVKLLIVSKSLPVKDEFNGFLPIYIYIYHTDGPLLILEASKLS